MGRFPIPLRTSKTTRQEIETERQAEAANFYQQVLNLSVISQEQKIKAHRNLILALPRLADVTKVSTLDDLAQDSAIAKEYEAALKGYQGIVNLPEASTEW